MSDALLVDAVALREEVKTKYREVAVNSHGGSRMAFPNGRWPACRLKATRCVR
jgi:hypothetical protein